MAGCRREDDRRPTMPRRPAWTMPGLPLACPAWPALACPPTAHMPALAIRPAWPAGVCPWPACPATAHGDRREDGPWSCLPNYTALRLEDGPYRRAGPYNLPTMAQLQDAARTDATTWILIPGRPSERWTSPPAAPRWPRPALVRCSPAASGPAAPRPRSRSGTPRLPSAGGPAGWSAAAWCRPIPILVSSSNDT